MGIGCLCVPAAKAQQPASSPVKVQAETGIRQYSYLKVELKLDFDSLRLGRKQSRVFTPVVSDGVHQQALRPVTVNGSWRHLLYLRHEDGTDGYVVRCGKDGAGMIAYTDSCLYRPWMKEAGLWLAEDLCGCGGEPMEQSVRPLLAKADGVERTKTSSVTLAMEGAASGEERKEERHKVARVTLFLDFLRFPVNRTEILSNFGNNRLELQKLTHTLDSLLSVPGVEIELVNMTGYSSPEGPYDNNERLAYGRTIALRDYLQHICSYRELPFRTASVAEDWEGLRNALQASDMPYREELLQIMATELSPDEKEERIKFLDRGRAYKILKRDFLPKLRRTVCEIHYQDFAAKPKTNL